MPRILLSTRVAHREPVRRLIVLAGFACALTACSKTPTSPAAPDESQVLLGQTVSAADGVPTPGLAVQIADRAAVTSDGEGRFAVEVHAQGPHDATIRGSTIVERRTTIVGPTAEPARVSLIPAGFDLVAFDEMFRASNGRLQRWTSRPALIVLASVMEYRQGAGTHYTATGEKLSASDLSQLTEHLVEGLGLLTGHTFTTFTSVTIERPEPGEFVNVAREGIIVAGRYAGVASKANTIGYGQWAELPNGTIAGGAMFLDSDFDRTDPRRRLLRIHELGHALGYQHVESRTSIMNPAIGPVPTEFDRLAAKIAFQRPPGNRPPDVDPRTTSGTFAVPLGGGQWRPPIYCH